MRRQLLMASIAAGLSLLVIVSLGETIARLLGNDPFQGRGLVDAWSEPHPSLGWINREGVVRSSEPGEVPMTFWSGGRRRSRPLEAGAREATSEAVLVGGSWLQGFGIVDEETLAWYASAALPDWRIENLGTGGYGTLQALKSAEVAAAEGRIDPDLLVYAFASFHGERNALTYSWARALRRRSGLRLLPPRATLEGTRLVRHEGTVALPDWPLEGASALVARLHDSWYAWQLRGREANIGPVTEALLSEVPRVAERIGARPLVMILYGGRSLPRYRKYMKREGIPVVDCRYPESPTRRHLRVGGVGHPIQIVHDHWGQCLVDWIEAHSPPEEH